MLQKKNKDAAIIKKGLFKKHKNEFYNKIFNPNTVYTLLQIKNIFYEIQMEIFIYFYLKMITIKKKYIYFFISQRIRI